MMNYKNFKSLSILFLIMLISFSFYAESKPKEPNKKSKEYFQIAIDTLQTATLDNIEVRKKIALKYLKKSISADNNNIHAYIWSVMILIDQQKYKQALSEIKMGIKRSKVNNNTLLPQLYMSQGGLYLLINDKSKARNAYKYAISEFNKILKEDKCNAEAIANIPIIFAMIEQKSKAINFIENNKSCYSKIDIKQFKQMINDLNIDDYIKKMKEN